MTLTHLQLPDLLIFVVFSFLLRLPDKNKYSICIYLTQLGYLCHLFKKWLMFDDSTGNAVTFIIKDIFCDPCFVFCNKLLMRVCGCWLVVFLFSSNLLLV